MVIIEANVNGSSRVCTFQSKFSAFYFLKQVKEMGGYCKEAVVTENRARFKIDASCTKEKYWDAAYNNCKEYEPSDKEFLFLIDSNDIREIIGGRSNFLCFVDPYSAAGKAEKKKQLDTFISSLNSKVIDMDMIESLPYELYLITIA